jgi:hypothetical protein
MRTPTSRLRRDVASSFVAGFRWRVEQFALSTPLPDVTVFSCDSFSPRTSGSAWEATLFRASHWLRTPCALRLREPNRDDVTSDALCHTTVLTQELRLPPSPGLPRASPCDEEHERPPPRQDTQYSCLFKAAIHPAQDAFDRIDALSCDWTELVRDHCSFTRPSSAPLSRDASLPSMSGRAATPPYPAPPWLASRLTSTAKRRCFSPTSATDPRYEHSYLVRFPRPQLAPRIRLRHEPRA